MEGRGAVSYDIGDIVALGVIVTDSAGTQVDTTPVTLTITLPDGTTVTPTVANLSVGEYSVQYTPTQSGRHTYRWLAGGTYPGAHTGTFYVMSSVGAIVSLDETKAYLGIPVADTSDDEELRHFIDVVSDFAETSLGWAARRQDAVTVRDGGSSGILLPTFPVLSVTSVTENGTTLSASDYALDAEAGLLTRLSSTYVPGTWAAGYRNIVVTYVAGQAVPPEWFRHGALVMVDHLWATQRGNNGPAGRAGADDLVIPGSTYTLPNRVAELWRLAPSVGFA